MPRAADTDLLNLDPLYIPGLITPVYTEGAMGGVNYNMIHANDAGLLIIVQVYQNMQEGDWIEVFWGDDDSPAAADSVLAEHVGKDFALFVRGNRIPEGIHTLYCTVTRSGGGNGGESVPLEILVRTEFPGDTDPEPDLPGHQNLLPPAPELPPSGIIDENVAKNGVKVVIPGYPNMRAFDVITFSWGGDLLEHTVTQAEVDGAPVEILVTEDVILEAGDSDQLVLVYKVRDEVHNPSSDWSVRTLVTVEVGAGLFSAPMIENPDPNANPFDVIDLEDLGEDDLLVSVLVSEEGGLQVGDEISLKWVGTTAQDQIIVVEPPPRTIPRVPTVLVFLIPNADLRQLAHGRGFASYTVTRGGSVAGGSRRSFVTFIGDEQRLPKPVVTDAQGDQLDPGLASTTVIVEGEALEAGDSVYVTWLGTRANGTPLVEEFKRDISGGSAGKPITLNIDGGQLIAPLDGGSLAVYYRVVKTNGLELHSERETLQVGEARGDLPAPTTRPPAENGVLDPGALPDQLQIVVPPWPGMSDGQTLYLLWRASSGSQYDDFIPINESMEGREIVFYMDRALVEANIGETIKLSYRVEIPDEPSRVSAIAAFTLEAAQAPLPLPEIIEAEGDRLDPNDVLLGATVRLDAAALFEDGDKITVRVISTVSGGSTNIEHVVPTGAAGEAVMLTISYGVIDVSRGTRVDLRYEINRAAGGPVEQSGTVSYLIFSAIDAGPVRVMGARFTANIWRASWAPRMLTALRDDTLAPMLVEWRYEDSEQWQAETTWNDEKPWLALYVRSSTETRKCWPANIVGNGTSSGILGASAFVAMRDEVVIGSDTQVDMIAWGDSRYGGELGSGLKGLKNVVEVSASYYGYAARLRNGNVTWWGTDDGGDQPPIIVGDYVQVRGTFGSFCGRQSNGELLAWGGGNEVPVPDSVRQHRDYVDVCGSGHAFAARRANGKVVAWGHPDRGGELQIGQDQFSDIRFLAASAYAFAALRDNGDARRVIAWGDISYGGVVPAEIAQLTNVRTLVANNTSFCILLDTGSVRAWPANESGGHLPDEIARLTNVVEVTSSAAAFCARLSDGRVAVWGNPPASEEAMQRTDIVQVTGNQHAFAALCRDGTVVAWGNAMTGGDTSLVDDQLVDVRAIYPNSQCFAALTQDGRVVTWGNERGGGDSEGVQIELRNKLTHNRVLTATEAAAMGTEVSGKNR